LTTLVQINDISVILTLGLLSTGLRQAYYFNTSLKLIGLVFWLSKHDSANVKRRIRQRWRILVPLLTSSRWCFLRGIVSGRVLSEVEGWPGLGARTYRVWFGVMYYESAQRFLSQWLIWLLLYKIAFTSRHLADFLLATLLILDRGNPWLDNVVNIFIIVIELFQVELRGPILCQLTFTALGL